MLCTIVGLPEYLLSNCGIEGVVVQHEGGYLRPDHGAVHLVKLQDIEQ